VHGDVFRPPRYLEVLAAMIGTGMQMALLVLSVILITIAGGNGALCLVAAGWLRA
jgi:transmembrane 9 superfamily protein 3